MKNPKIEKVNAAIAKTKTIIAGHQIKLRELERQKTQLENDEIVAMFRRERLNEDEFAKLLRANRARDETASVSEEVKIKRPAQETGKEDKHGEEN